MTSLGLSGLGLALALLLCASSPTFAGPDPNPLQACRRFHDSLSPEARVTARDMVQSIQALDSYVSQAALGIAPPTSVPGETPPGRDALEGWRNSNASALLSLMQQAGLDSVYGSADKAAAVARTCLSSRLHPDGFLGQPIISVLLNYFKRPQAVHSQVANQRASCQRAGMACELTVNVDNPDEAAAWVRELVPAGGPAAESGGASAGNDTNGTAAGAGGFLVPVFSWNVHEVRGYNRASRLARGRYMVVWQDDQVPPEDGQWLGDMMRIFDAHPLMGVLGMNTHRLCRQHERTNRFGPVWFEKDPAMGVKWTYAQYVDFAPLAIRASIFREVGGLDEGLGQRGDCGIWSDWELSARVWMDGWTVGFTYMDGRYDDGQPGGTHKGAEGERCWGRQQHVASSVFHRRYGASGMMEPSCERVWLLNMAAHKAGDRCPYAQETNYRGCKTPDPAAAAALEQELANLQAARIRLGTGAWTAGRWNGTAASARGALAVGTGAGVVSPGAEGAAAAPATTAPGAEAAAPEAAAPGTATPEAVVAAGTGTGAGAAGAKTRAGGQGGHGGHGHVSRGHTYVWVQDAHEGGLDLLPGLVRSTRMGAGPAEAAATPAAGSTATAATAGGPAAAEPATDGATKAAAAAAAPEAATAAPEAAAKPAEVAGPVVGEAGAGATAGAGAGAQPSAGAAAVGAGQAGGLGIFDSLPALVRGTGSARRRRRRLRDV
ncbi:hypothetical protein HYH03_011797 [Edaphochlamys debaryana]|uniref:Glycosyltransferase 2-like domain-containing protein n=1 Tax=Edaphochlamys debaryana TaxID=47281 RepID=A0A836BW26_9CHLO|nr:hypothetical protein HYH03_011797 [Edaphochlamys debaryana]|eukprot:KAG2489688.1 hypothetical protein HYH03_011797 [Edaphochlamys debaryana]